MKKVWKRWAALCLAGVLSLGTLSGLELKVSAAGKNLITNPDFAQEDVAAWQAGAGGATISAETLEDPVYGDVKTCGKISGRTSAYDCFAQDITAVVEDGKKYEFSFYAMLSQDYEGAPADQRVLDFAPYVTVDGQTTYLGSYSAEIQGTSSQSLTPGKWTKYEGTFELNYGKQPQQVVIRLLEQGTEYGQGDCVKGEYYVTGVTLKETGKKKAQAEVEDITPLRDAVTAATDENFIMGTSIDGGDINDAYCMALVTKHFNAVTFGNSLKPDALFGYSNDRCPGTEEVEFNGETMTVPKVDYSRAERLLNVIKEWNDENPDRRIRVRGHVLVWHAQTPEWFFHEDYDKNKDYVDKEEMNKRLEWYIATILGHFTGEDSPYKGMFYGWDVVNEAVSDRKGYRKDNENANEPLSRSTHGSNSSWWHVYQSNEYIINAFKYANKYAPADVELYYNDYNEFNMTKKNDIITLIKDVKAAEGTRLDGFGMQGHYGLNSPDANMLGGYILEYANAAGKVQITELDVGASSSYDGTDATKDTEYKKQALYYMRIYNAVKEARQNGHQVTGITFWGVVDKYSWLQSSSNVGGGSDGKRKQCPLLFDDDYKAKPAYWAFVDPSVLGVKTNFLPGATEAPKATEEPKPTETPVPTEEPTVTNAPATEPSVELVDGEVKEVTWSPLSIGLGAGVLVLVVIGGVIFVKKKKQPKTSKADDKKKNS